MLFDDIYREIGEFGTYQILIYCALGMIGIPTGWQNMAITFIGADMDSWCKVDGLQNLTMEQQRNLAIPYADGGYNRCEYYALDYSVLTQNDLVNWNRSHYNYTETPVKTCSAHMYDTTQFISTVVSQWDLSCDRAPLRSLIQTIYMAGFLTGCVVFGQISDKIGRRKTLMVSMVIHVTFALGATFCPYYVLYCILRFCVGMAASGSFTTMFVLTMEIIGAKYRMVTGILVQCWFSLGLMTYPGISYFIRDHITLQLITGSCPVVLIPLLFIAPESPRWYVAHGHDEEAEDLIRKIARHNRRKCPENLYLEENRESDEREPKGSIIDLVGRRNIRKITLLMMFCWFSISLAYYGLSLGVDFLQGSLFFNSFLSGAVELPAYVIVPLTLAKLGRKWPTVICFILVAVFCVMCVPFFGNATYDVILTVFLMLGKCFSAAAFAMVYVYAAELFPTVVRNVGVGTCSMSARISGFLQPQVALAKVSWEPLPFIIYGGMSLLAGCASFFFPETRGQRLPETLEDVENFGKRRRHTLPTISAEAPMGNGQTNLDSTENNTTSVDAKKESCV